MVTPFYYPIEGTTSPLFHNQTLILPAVSIGSVPQLAVDLLLHHKELQLTKVATLDPSFCFAFVGPSDSTSHHHDHDLTTPLEVYSNGTLTVIQQRSPVFKSREIDYISALTNWILTSQFKQILWLTSIDAAARIDPEFSTPILSLSPSPLPSGGRATPLLSSIVNSFPTFNPVPQTNGDSFEHIPHIPGSLLTRKLLYHIKQHNNKNQDSNTINLVALLYFAAEGDTRQDAHFLANLILNLLFTTTNTTSTYNHSSHIQKQWLLENQPPLQQPNSWSALFGKMAESSLYA
ncbi:related to ADD66 - protein involved in 20S proteasome assembly [Melanopsichium pennsylvanicum]|uniref:Proteasome assembly chaperone 2 n=1 Tax=Melanopsichium pennsylvanicum TaxID=63383 RepID=A0AAJ4XQV4_9BASI|nr:related to ADD66 - protein involved in 20S proteasome assembly [Melanopsichium pennsylvanicum]